MAIDNVKYHGSITKKFRESRLISKHEMARRAQLSVGAVSRFENDAPVRIETVRRVINGLGLSVKEAKARGLISFV
jgi:transcriptional regulator with XRE-family HTH domain